MGVLHLTSYLEKDKPSALCYEVDIVELAKEYERKEDRQAVIVVDGTSTLYTFFDHKRSDWLMGGQLSVWKDKLQNFVDAFKAAGIKMVFFFDGSVVERKRYVWMERQTEKIKKQIYIFKCLKDGKFPMKPLLPAMVGACGRFIYQDLGCEVLVSVEECDVEIASYARANNCLAVLAQDTDLLIHKGAQYFLSLKDLNVATMRTVCYDREALATSLSLNENHLPLFASLMGNDCIPIKLLKDFHMKLCSGEVTLITKKVHKLADYVRKFSSGDLCRSHLTTIADEVFGDRDMAKCLEDSINLYSGSATISADKDWDVMPEARYRHMTCQMPPLIYPIMRGQPYELSIGLEDFDGGIEAAAKVYRPMRQRLYGVLLHDDPTHQDTVEEWCVEANTISETALRVEVHRVPENFHPNLLRLWTENSNMMDKRKWEIFAWCISPSMDVSMLYNIHPKYCVPAAALYYIVHQGKHLLSEWEVEAIISQAVLLQIMNVRDLTNLWTPFPEPRAIQVASLFGRGITTVLLVMAACGISLMHMMPWVYYDGRLFFQQYVLAKKGQGLVFQRAGVQVMSDFQSVYKFVYGE